jgi:hypothetical protein
MNIYHYNPETGKFTGQDVADESPLEPGVFLIPGYATDIEPPTCSDTEQVVFVDGAWEIQPLSEPEPLPEPEPKLSDMELLRLERNKRLYATDYLALSDQTLTSEMAAYRQALRDLPANTVDPANPVWPIKPS